MSTVLTIVAHIQAKMGQADFIKAELLKLIEPTLNEEACIQYDLHLSNTEPEQFLFFENWKDRDTWQEHMNTPHIMAFIESVEEHLESFHVQEMTKIS